MNIADREKYREKIKTKATKSNVRLHSESSSIKI